MHDVVAEGVELGLHHAAVADDDDHHVVHQQMLAGQRIQFGGGDFSQDFVLTIHEIVRQVVHQDAG